MKPYYSESGIEIYLGDWRVVLPSLPQVDHIITDPPYADRTHAGALTNKTSNAPNGYRQGGSKLVNFDCLTDEAFEFFCKEALLKTNRWVVMTCDHRHAARTFDWDEHIRLGVWVKGAPMPQITGDRPGSGHESVLILHNKGKKRWNGGGRPAVWNATVIKDPSQVFIPTQKPIKLITQFVSDFTEPNEIILDPFMGSGTTLRAAKDLRRQAIGIEIDEAKCAIAATRLSQEILKL
jgi:site-specific DNA-methyltransferase (adenine-specific)